MSLEDLSQPVEQTESTPSVMGQPTEPEAPQEPTEPTPTITSIDDYKVEVDGFNFDEFKAIDENKEFLERAKEAGLGNKELGFLLGEYNQLIPNLMQANAALDNEATVKTMNEAWGSEADTNFGFARSAAENLVKNGVLTLDDVNNPAFGNNPLVLKMAAHFGAQLSEDTPPTNTQQNSGDDIQSLMSSEAYLNDKHPDHKRVYAQVQTFYDKQYA